MGFSSILGQATPLLTLERALADERVHHAYRFEGPDGVGKESTALRLAQALVCPDAPLGCETCSACRRVLHFSETPPQVPAHPDVLVVERGLYPAALIGTSEATGISVDQIRSIVQPRVGMPPHEARHLVIIIRRADELTVAAANALLKTLEEPPRHVHFILLTSRPGRLLDTIRSRTLALRFGPLDHATLGQLFAREGLPEAVLTHCAGSMTRARALAEPEQRGRREEFLGAADEALAAPHPAAAIAFADQRPEGRDELQALLTHLGIEYAERARTSGQDMALWARRHAEVQRARAEAERNVSPALVLESLMLRLRGD